MRVLHVIPSLSPTEGGPSFAAKAMADALAGEGVEVTIATTRGSREQGARGEELENASTERGSYNRDLQRVRCAEFQVSVSSSLIGHKFSTTLTFWIREARQRCDSGV